MKNISNLELIQHDIHFRLMEVLFRLNAAWCYRYWWIPILFIMQGGFGGKDVLAEKIKFNQSAAIEWERNEVIGILGSHSLPRKKFEAYVSPRITLKPKAGDAFLFGMTEGFVKGIFSCFRGPGDPAAAFAVAVFGTACTISRSVFGGITNSIVIPKPVPNNDAAEYLLASSQFPASVQNLFLNRVFISAREQTRRSLIVLSNHSAGSIQEKTNYQSLNKTGIGIVLKVAITELSHTGGLYGTPIAMVVKARAELIRTVDGTSIFGREYRFDSPRREISYWRADEEQLFADSISSAVEMLAGHIVHDTLLMDPRSQTKVQFHKLSLDKSTRPEPVNFLGVKTRCNDCTGGLVRTKPGNPTFYWQPAIEPAIYSEQYIAEPEEFEKTVFDIVLYRRSREKTVVGAVTPFYSRYGLSKPIHRIEIPLKGCSHYFWSVRARYSSADHYHSTD